MGKKEPSLFIGIFPAGISYCDRSREVKGDYKKIAFLSYATLDVEVYDLESPLLPQILKHAEGMNARRGEDFVIDACGHTVKLGGGS